MRFIFRSIYLRCILYCLLVLGWTASLQAAKIERGPYLQQIAPDGVTVCWATDEAVTGAILYGQRSLDKKQDAEAARLHRVRLNGLKPATVYRYQVVCGDLKSDTFSFKTAPISGGGFSFVAYGDNRTHPEDHRKVAERILSLKPDLVVNTGDLVADGNKAELWPTFFDVAGRLMAQAPYYPSLGNHEGNSPLYFEIFALPGAKRYYSFNYGNCHFVCLDSNEPFMAREEQRHWLIEDLSHSQDAAFRIVFFHHPPYTLSPSKGRQKYSEKIREQWQKIFEDFHVALVLNGHDHNYQRAKVNGIQYIVTGGGGAPLYPVGEKRPWNVKAASVHHCVEFRVKDDRIQARAITPDGKTIDSFELTARR